MAVNLKKKNYKKYFDVATQIPYSKNFRLTEIIDKQ